MPAPRREEYDSEEFKRLWYSRTTVEEMAEKYGVAPVCIHHAAMRREFDTKFVARAQ